MPVARGLTSPPILPARNAQIAILPLATTRDASTTIQEEAPSSLLTTLVRATPRTHLRTDSGKNDPIDTVGTSNISMATSPV